MKRFVIRINLVIFISILFCQIISLADSPVLKGPYFGQKPPGMIPEIFAPGFISTDKKELNSVFTPDAKEFYFSINIPGEGYQIYFTAEKENGWTIPEPVSFSSSSSDVDMCLTYDGNKMYFGSNRPVNGIPPNNYRIWYVDRIEDRWSEAIYLESPVNSGKRALYPTISQNGTMYFQAQREDSLGSSDIYHSPLIDGKYSQVLHLDDSINSVHDEGDVLIAPDESFLIVNCTGRADNLGRSDLFISFRNNDGGWTRLKNMGPIINSSGTDYCPMLSPDGKYFFFTSTKTGNGDIYWVDVKFIENMQKDL